MTEFKLTLNLMSDGATGHVSVTLEGPNGSKLGPIDDEGNATDLTVGHRLNTNLFSDVLAASGMDALRATGITVHEPERLELARKNDALDTFSINLDQDRGVDVENYLRNAIGATDNNFTPSMRKPEIYGINGNVCTSFAVGVFQVAGYHSPLGDNFTQEQLNKNEAGQLLGWFHRDLPFEVIGGASQEEIDSYDRTNDFIGGGSGSDTLSASIFSHSETMEPYSKIDKAAVVSSKRRERLVESARFGAGFAGHSPDLFKDVVDRKIDLQDVSLDDDEFIPLDPAVTSSVQEVIETPPDIDFEGWQNGDNGTPNYNAWGLYNGGDPSDGAGRSEGSNHNGTQSPDRSEGQTGGQTQSDFLGEWLNLYEGAFFKHDKEAASQTLSRRSGDPAASAMPAGRQADGDRRHLSIRPSQDVNDTGIDPRHSMIIAAMTQAVIQRSKMDRPRR